MKRSGRGVPERLSGLRDAKDRGEALETAVRSFANVQWMEQHLEQALWRGPVFDPEHTRVAVAKGRVVSVVVMGPRRIRFGPVRVRAMTLGPVGTHDRHRKRGYSAATMNDASRYMKEHGFLLAYLQGVPDFYYRFGYYPFMAPSSVKFTRENARKECRPGRLRLLTRRDLPRVRALYDEATAGRLCAAARDAQLWEWLVTAGRRTWLFRSPRVILNGGGHICGYVCLNPKGDLAVREVVVKQDEASCRAALGALVREAKRREAKEVSLPLPWDDAMTVLLRQCVGAEFTLRSNPTGGALLKIVDLPALLHTLHPLFTQRWRTARAVLPSVRFTLSSEIGAAGFAVSSDKVTIGPAVRGPRVVIPARWLSGLLTGYYSVRDIAPKPQAAIPSNLVRPMEILFPPGWPFVYQADNY